MAQRVKTPYLETSPEKFQQLLGSGFSSLDSPTRTGNPTPAILLPKKGSSLLLVNQSDSVLEDTLERMMDKEPENRRSGTTTEIDADMLSFWVTRIPIPQRG